jgi:RHS repeat-associated protein
MDTHHRWLRSALLAGLLLLSAVATQAQQKVTYYHTDLQGSPVAATDANGNIVWREDYAPYGERRTFAATADANHSWYLAKPQDQDTGLSYLGARSYDPVVGRFYGIDPASVDESDPDTSFNRYAYGRNSPYRFIDPDGKRAILFVRAPGEGATNFGHTALRVYGPGYDYTYDFGRYRGGTGFLHARGPGILRVWTKWDAFLATQSGEGTPRQTNLDTPKEFDEEVIAYFNKKINEGKQVGKRKNMTEFQLKEDYALLSNNCTTICLGALKDADAKTSVSISGLPKLEDEYRPKALFDALQRGVKLEVKPDPKTTPR